jgi:uncharacterized membrane protein
MQPKKSKYDTNPLDPEVAKHTEEVWGQEEGAANTDQIKAPTRPVGRPANENPRNGVQSEAPTRHFDNRPTDGSYPSVFVPPTYAPPPAVYQPPPSAYQQPVIQAPASRTVEGLGISERWAMILPYTPIAYIGVVAAIIELILVPRKESRVRAHAAQGLALFAAIIAIELLFKALGVVTGSAAGATIFWLVSRIFLIISMIRVWQGATHRIAPLAEPAEWLNKHIDPRK